MSGPQKEKHVESKKAAYTSFGIPRWYVIIETPNEIPLLIITSCRSQLQASSLLSPTLAVRLSGLRIWSPLEPLRQASRNRQRRQSEDDITLVASTNLYQSHIGHHVGQRSDWNHRRFRSSCIPLLDLVGVSIILKVYQDSSITLTASKYVVSRKAPLVSSVSS
jgi:hypothetical protein